MRAKAAPTTSNRQASNSPARHIAKSPNDSVCNDGGSIGGSPSPIANAANKIVKATLRIRAVHRKVDEEFTILSPTYTARGRVDRFFRERAPAP